VHGWLSIDYAFVLTLAPIPIFVILGKAPMRDRAWHCLVCVIALGTGFTFAHTLHFLEVVAYHGGFREAVHDFISVAKYRSGDRIPHGTQQIPAQRWQLVSLYLADLYRSTMMGGFAWLISLLPVVVAVIRRGTIRRDARCLGGVSWRWSVNRYCMGVALALVICSIWPWVMTNHAWQHIHFLPRHFFLLYFVVVTGFVAGFRFHSPTIPSMRRTTE
jgi:hypothetical protein